MSKKLLYEITFSILAIIAVYLAFVDITEESMSPTQEIIDWSIWSLFAADYLVRFYLASNKIHFFKMNLLDLIALIPFSSFFRALRILKLVRLIVYGARLLKRFRSFFNTNGFKYVLLLTLTILLTGAFLIHCVEKMDFEQALWWAFVTITTVGYGDISPSTGMGRIIASILMLVGIGLIGSFTSTITSFFLNAKESLSNQNIPQGYHPRVDGYFLLTLPISENNYHYLLSKSAELDISLEQFISSTIEEMSTLSSPKKHLKEG